MKKLKVVLDLANGTTSCIARSIFEQFDIKKVKLLKIDCEGSEFDIIKKTKVSNLKNIEYLIGEFHQSLSKRPDCYNEDLENYCKKYIKNVNVKKIIC